MNEFWALVGNTRWAKRTRGYSTMRWWRLYVYLFSLIVLGCLGYAIYRGAGPIILTVFIPFQLLLAFTGSMDSIFDEWRGQTASWWLTLPYPRAELLLAKLVGAFIYFLKIIAGSVVVLAALTAVGMPLNPAVWTAGALSAAATVAARLYLATLAILPLAITIGMLAAVTRESRLKPLTPIILVGAVMYPFMLAIRYTTDGVIKTAIKGTAINLAFPASPVNPPMIAAGVAAILILSLVIFGAASYILAEQTEA